MLTGHLWYSLNREVWHWINGRASERGLRTPGSVDEEVRQGWERWSVRRDMRINGKLNIPVPGYYFECLYVERIRQMDPNDPQRYILDLSVDLR